MPTLKKQTRKCKGGFFGNQNADKTWYQNIVDWKTWNISDPITYPSYDETMYYYKKGSTNYGKIPEPALQPIPYPNADWKYEPYEIPDQKQIVESKYPQQISLPIENVLPSMKSSIQDPIRQRKILMTSMPSRRENHVNAINYFWTNDDNILATATTPHTACNSFATPNGQSQEGRMYPNKMYFCVIEKMCYFIDQRIASLEAFDFTLKTPTYSPIPYTFTHFGNFFGRKMNLFKMILSTRLFELLQTKNKEWLNHIPLSTSTSFTLERKMMHQNIPGQLITPVLKSSLKGYDTDNDEFKIQIFAKDEYVYWMVETLLLNFQRLVDVGLKRFKYMFLIGENNLFSITEIFPDILISGINNPIEHYTHKGIQFKTELLNMPNIVLYTRNQDNYTDLMHVLCELFPNKFPLSKGISRFNMRINDNVTFSICGNNENKFIKNSDVIPAEYKLIINKVRLNPERCDELIPYSKMVTGNTLLNDDCTVNKILSYNNTVSIFPSFKAIYTQYGLMEYYVPLPPDLDAQIATMKITDSDIDLYRDILISDQPNAVYSELSKPETVLGGNKTYKKKRKGNKNTNKI
jgi:hypothetical protein